MLKFLNHSYNIKEISDSYPSGSIEIKIINILNSSRTLYSYDSLEELSFELKLREAIIDSSIDLYNSNFSFKTFDEAKCNSKFWKKTSEGAFLLNKEVKPSEAIRDIYENSSEYGTECSTAMVILHYRALLQVFPEKLFDKLFHKIYLMNWHSLDPNLRELGYLQEVADYLPGDRRYVRNPDVNPETPEWQGENIIDLSNGLYYGHGIGIGNVEEIIRELNKNRKKDSTVSAYLIDSVSRPNFKHLYNIYNKFTSHVREIKEKASREIFIRYPLNYNYS